MARPSKSSGLEALAPSTLLAWADALGESLGLGLARGLSTGLSTNRMIGLPDGAKRKRGRPPKPVAPGAVPLDRRCSVEGCVREARSKGLCSAHYQAERRRRLKS